MARTLVNVPPNAKRGQIVEMKRLISYVIETGLRGTETGVPIPRNIITDFTCTHNGTEIFRADLHQATSASRSIAFFTVATESGALEFRWTGDNGLEETAQAKITVE
jgi:sulfur-oxidizing protein SoxZ